VVNLYPFDPEESKTFRPISPCPITGVRADERPMSPPPRPFTPLPEWEDADEELEDFVCPPLPASSPPPAPLSPPPDSDSSSAVLKFHPRSTSQPSNILLRITPRERKRPVSAPGTSSASGRTLSPTGSPVFRMPRPKSSSMENSRFVKYRNFQQLDDRHRDFLRGKENAQPPQVLVEPKWQVPQWSVEEVVMWVNKAGFKEYSAAFRESAVDGDILLTLTDANIREDIGIKNGILRKRFMRELKNLKKNADYSCSDSGNTSNFLAKISPEFRSYTYNLISHDLTYDYMLRLDPGSLEDMLKYAGIESSIHRHKIVEAIIGEDEDSVTDSLYSEPTSDVYISYPRGGGAELASLISMQMQMRGFSVVTDAHDGTTVSDLVLGQIRDARFYVLVLPSGALDQCLASSYCRLHTELVAALDAGCNIVPVTLDFQWPDPQELPEDIRALCYFNGVRWVHDYQTACIDKLEKFIRADPLLRAESPYPKSGRSTPSLLSPYTKQKGLRNRTMSIDSAIGSSTLL